ncbi:hypothetical protein BDQ94DRAFT_138160 [Aspergillus welwitschiae]|uniref:Uncharacterized protein n=1 Tax=Aspergillus welwitschiae TaxID=1341132 RepID=A0A3F3QBP7_9EURO|nr:hypothetical protein BDQ94DRAFT_138160 [Aspergillus welwitschiae]RDH36621.1 hypothetical protein BDQ94DRAFT_138160 [Aspergillus welwitschiae]
MAFSGFPSCSSAVPACCPFSLAVAVSTPAWWHTWVRFLGHSQPPEVRHSRSFLRYSPVNTRDIMILEYNLLPYYLKAA